MILANCVLSQILVGVSIGLTLPQDGMVSLTGTITRPDGLTNIPVKGVRVLAISDGRIREAKSDEMGIYRINIPASPRLWFIVRSPLDGRVLEQVIDGTRSHVNDVPLGLSLRGFTNGVPPELDLIARLVAALVAAPVKERPSEFCKDLVGDDFRKHFRSIVDGSVRGVRDETRVKVIRDKGDDITRGLDTLQKGSN
jgi:hypothetical protein